jgi:hypothetical protein
LSDFASFVVFYRGIGDGSGKLLDYGPDVTVLEDQASGLLCFPDGDIRHGAGQVVGPYHLVGEEHPKHGVNDAQEAVAQIRFLPRLHWVDVRGPEEINAGEPRRK